MIFFSLMLVLNLLSGEDKIDSILVIALVLLLAAFCLLLIITVFLNMLHAFLFAGKPVLVFNDLGIIDHTRIFPVGLIRWDEIEEIFPCSFLSSSGATRRLKEEKGLGIRLRDREGFLSRYNLITRVMIRLKSLPGYFIIQTGSLIFEDNDIEGLIGTLGRRFKVKAGKGGIEGF